MRTHRIATALLAPVLAVSLAACGGDGGADEVEPTAEAGSEEAVTVTVKTFDFQPDPLEVDAGTVVHFVNEDAIDHTVTAGTREDPTPEVFDGQLPEQGATFDLTLDEPGTYDYFCQIHPGPGMTASIVVR